MTSGSAIQWKRLSAEAIAIVGSILLAFWVDAWWEDTQRREDEEVLLQALLDDLTQKSEGLVEERQYQEAVLQAVMELLNNANQSDTSLSGDYLDELIQRTWWYTSAEWWNSAPIESIVNGQLQTISDPALIQRVSELQIMFERITDFYDIDKNFHFNIYSPFLIQNAYMPQLTNAAQHFPGFPEERDPYPEIAITSRTDHTSLLRSKEFQNMLVAKMDVLNSIFRYGHAGVEEKLDEVIEMLTDELAE